MKNLKYLQRFFILLFVGFALCAVQACGDDEENEPIQEPNEEEVVKPDDGKEEDEPSDKPVDTMEAVDLGLSVKWATCNVGASKPEEYGDYFAWGETTTKSDYSWETYKWCTGTAISMTKYCTDTEYGSVDGLTTLSSSDDVATVKWGKNWRMPTEEEFNELLYECTWTWTKQNGISGSIVTGPSGKSIFLPATGYCDGTAFHSRISNGYYWSATLGTEYGNSAYNLCFRSDDGYCYDYNRYCGRTVRPVTDELSSYSGK